MYLPTTVLHHVLRHSFSRFHKPFFSFNLETAQYQCLNPVFSAFANTWINLSCRARSTFFSALEHFSKSTRIPHSLMSGDCFSSDYDDIASHSVCVSLIESDQLFVDYEIISNFFKVCPLITMFAKASDILKVSHLYNVSSTVSMIKTRSGDPSLYLSYFENLKTLHIHFNRAVRDLKFLNNCKKLEKLYLWDLRIDDLSPIIHCKFLEELDLYSNELTDISPLSFCTQLRRVNIWSTDITSIQPLASCQLLEVLSLNYTAVVDLSPLVSCLNLIELSVQNTLVNDVSCLLECKKLKKLELRGSLVEDVSVLESLEDLIIRM
ncbi:hypothetical protein RCL1_003488 [Eukaryota sp. TZLM3-RCL]